MSKLNWGSIKNGISKRSPQILTAVAVLEFAATVYLAVKATPKAEKMIHEAEAEKGASLTPVETVKAAWKCYIPTAIAGACTVTSMIGANSIALKRNAMLTAACQLTETAFREYKDKVVETIGEKKEAVIQDAIAQDYMNRVPINETQIINTGEGTMLFRDHASGRDFLHDKVKIEQACNRLNRTLLSFDYVSLNEFYNEIGLDDIGIGDSLGWNASRDGLIELKFSTCVASNGQPCFLLRFNKNPTYGYRRD